MKNLILTLSILFLFQSTAFAGPTIIPGTARYICVAEDAFGKLYASSGDSYYKAEDSALELCEDRTFTAKFTCRQLDCNFHPYNFKDIEDLLDEVDDWWPYY